MVDFWPSWMTWEIEDALKAIKGAHARKKRTTVLRLAEGKVVGRSMTATFALGDTCSETTWYGRYRKGKKRPGWCEDKTIQRALKLATDRAHYVSDGYVGEQIAETQRKLAHWGPGSVDVLAVLMTKASSEAERRRSAVEILDRLGTGEVASKATVSSSGDQVVSFDLSGLPVEIVRLIAEQGESGGNEAGGAS